MIEKIFYNDKDYVTFDIPESGYIGAFMSGGADSSLMCYIMAKIIQDNQLPTKIVPVSGEMLARPYNLRCAYNVTRKISELTGHKFENHPTFTIPNFDRKISDEEKPQVMAIYTRSYAIKFGFHVLYNGLTANPPIEIVKDTIYGKRIKCRDDDQWQTRQENKHGLYVPFIRVDKKVIGMLYKKLGILETIYPLTRSCEAEMDETEFFTKDCFDIRNPGEECWWCRERQYGFSNL